MSTQPQKTIAEIAKEANKPPKPPTAGSKIHSKWIAQIEKFIGAEVTVRAGAERTYVGRFVATDGNQQHVILDCGHEVVWIRSPWTISRNALARTSAPDLAGQPQTPEKTEGAS